MLNSPKTLEDAKKYRYNQWVGNPKGNKYTEGDCVWEVWSDSVWHPYQCSRKNGYGPQELYCKQHAKKVED